MLLIAQPKSASTSLMWSISEIYKIPHKNGQSFTKNDKKCQGYEELQKYHGTTVQRNYEYLHKYITAKNIIYKEHILPIKQHVDIINKINQNVIVLLRKPEETIESYKRVFSVLPELGNIDWKKLYYEVNQFYETYYFLNNPLYLIIHFRDVVFKFHETMKKIGEHYQLEIPNDLNKYELQKRNYTGHGIRKILGEK